MRKNSLIFVICLAVALAMAAVPVLAKMAPAGVQVVGQKNNTSTLQGQIKNQNGQTNAEEHRSAVANFVQTLLKTASTTEGTVGEQVRIIAREQNRAMATTTEMMEKIQNRNKIKTFLFGSDYKNLGALRSEMVQTRNRIEQLNRIMGKKASTTEVQTQIQNLEQEQTRMENFIKAQEGKFSLFGWLTKWFNK